MIPSNQSHSNTIKLVPTKSTYIRKPDIASSSIVTGLQIADRLSNYGQYITNIAKIVSDHSTELIKVLPTTRCGVHIICM